MQPFDSIERLERLSVLDPVARRVAGFSHRVTQPRALRDLLHGVWLGHPLHPMLVQVPIGAWASAAVLDLVPGTGPAAGLLIGTGIATAVPAALTGSTDWSELHPEQQRVGLVHAASNVVALGLYAGSLAARSHGRYARGKLLGFAGLAAVAFSGLLGGHLSYRQGAGANHAEDVPHLVPPGWSDIGALADLPDGEAVRRMLGVVPLFVLRRGADVHVLADACSHLAGPLHEGTVLDSGELCVQCPWHASTFRLRDGHVVHGPATAPQPVFETRVLSDHVEVRLPGAG